MACVPRDERMKEGGESSGRLPPLTPTIYSLLREPPAKGLSLCLSGETVHKQEFFVSVHTPRHQLLKHE